MRLDFSSMPLWFLLLMALVNISTLITSIAKLFTIVAGAQKKKDQNSAARIIIQQRNIASSVKGQKTPRWVLWLMGLVPLQMVYFGIDVLLMKPAPEDRIFYALTFFGVAAINWVACLAAIHGNRQLSRW